ncbi:MAG: hypothetical protein RL588_1634 [Pseudomonadota bacterium]
MSPALRPSPAILASGLLHLGVLAALILVRPPAGDPAGEGPPVTVRLATSGDLSAAQAAAAGPPETPAPAEAAPAEAAPAEAVPPPPTPTPAPAPSPAPTPTPTRRASETPAPVPKPAPAARPQPLPKTAATPGKPAAATTAAPRRPAGGLDLDALAGQVSRLGGNRPGPPAAAGGARSGPSAAALAGMQDQLQKLWNPNCGVEGGRDVRVRVSFTLAPAGDLSGPVEAGGLERSDNPVVRAAAERAIRAVHQAAPFPDLASPTGQRIAVNFNAREACS